MNLSRKHLLTATVVAVAILLVLLKYWDYILNPWTRDGQVRAEVIQITPRVSGPLVSLSAVDNQFVKAGDLLFEIDPRTYAASLAQAKANLQAPWLGFSAFIVLALILALLVFAGEAVRDAFDPRKAS